MTNLLLKAFFLMTEANHDIRLSKYFPEGGVFGRTFININEIV